MRARHCACVGVLTAGILAQEPLPERVPVANAPSDPAVLAEVRKRLASESFANLAWGAHLAAEHQVREATPELVLALAHLRPRLLGRAPDPPADAIAQPEATALALLDGLIRLHARVPAAEIERFLAWPTLEAALVLLAQRPHENADILLAFFRRKPEECGYTAWLATGNLLARTRAPGFAAAVLDGLELWLSVVVQDPRSTSMTTSCRFGDLTARRLVCLDANLPDAFPEVGGYALLNWEPWFRSVTLLAPGRSPVYAERRILTRGKAYRCQTESDTRTDNARLRWLADLLDAKQPLPIEDNHGCELTPTTAEEYLAQVAAEREGIERAFRGVISELVRRRHLTAAERERAPRIAVHVHDMRRAGAPPLPLLPGESPASVRRDDGQR